MRSERWNGAASGGWSARATVEGAIEAVGVGVRLVVDATALDGVAPGSGDPLRRIPPATTATTMTPASTHPPITSQRRLVISPSVRADGAEASGDDRHDARRPARSCPPRSVPSSRPPDGRSWSRSRPMAVRDPSRSASWSTRSGRSCGRRSTTSRSATTTPFPWRASATSLPTHGSASSSTVGMRIGRGSPGCGARAARRSYNPPPIIRASSPTFARGTRSTTSTVSRRARSSGSTSSARRAGVWPAVPGSHAPRLPPRASPSNARSVCSSVMRIGVEHAWRCHDSDETPGWPRSFEPIRMPQPHIGSRPDARSGPRP